MSLASRWPGVAVLPQRSPVLHCIDQQEVCPLLELEQHGMVSMHGHTHGSHSSLDFTTDQFKTTKVALKYGSNISFRSIVHLDDKSRPVRAAWNPASCHIE